MTTANNIYKHLCDIAPLELQMGFDNSGFLFGRYDAPVSKVLLSLDITEKVIAEAIELGSELIISHHPLIFSPIKNITDDKLLKLAENSIAVICMHTNLDIANGGVNDVLIELLGANGNEILDESGCGRIGYLEESMELIDFLFLCKNKLSANGLRYYSAGRPVHKLAVMGGAGGDSLVDAFSKGCDTYVTSDIKYNRFLEAADMGINLIDAGHFCTENPVIFRLRNSLAAAFPDTDFFISKVHGQLISFI